MIRRSFLVIALVFLGCRRDPAPRPLPEGHWWKKGAALRIDGKRIQLVRRLETEPAPLFVEGPFTSTMNRDGSFTVALSVDTLKRELLSKRREGEGPADIHQPLETARFDGEPIAKGGVVGLKLEFSNADHAVEMCFTSSKSCLRLQQE